MQKINKKYIFPVQGVDFTAMVSIFGNSSFSSNYSSTEISNHTLLRIFTT